MGSEPEENMVSTLEDSTQLDSKELQALQLQVRWFQEEAIDTENCLIWKNICILVLPERAEGTWSTEFAEQLFIAVLGIGSVLFTFVVDREHRVPPTPKPGAPVGLFC